MYLKSIILNITYKVVTKTEDLNILAQVKNYIKMEQNTQKSYTITKKIAKHGSNAVIVIPKFLQDDLKPQTIVEVRINILKEAKND